MSYLFHNESLKEPSYRARTNLAQFGFTFLNSLALFFFFVFPGILKAQTVCGDIVTISYGEEDRTPIYNCDDPFETADSTEVYNFIFTLNGEEITDGDTKSVTELPQTLGLVSPFPSGRTAQYVALYKHEGLDYRYIAGTDSLEPSLAIVATGTYSIVTSVFFPSGGGSSFNISNWERVWTYLLPTAHAQTFRFIRTEITFTVLQEEVPPPPVGASSVLFLPGIQASRLYTEGVLGTEDQLWEPNIDNDVVSLAMTEGGQSVNEIYTKDLVNEIFGINNIYQSFLNMMEEMVTDGQIKSFVPFAYDWRYDAHDVVVSGTQYENEVRSLITEVENLAENSYTGKVTLIGHSNGGLLAKELLTELERLGNEQLIDKVIFVGVPQLGTPKALGVLLHGMDQQAFGGLIINDTTAREVTKNMPGAYALLPTARYFDLSNTSLIQTDMSSITESIREYGEITSRQSLVDFLVDSEERRTETVSVNDPAKLNLQIFADTEQYRDRLDAWRAPEGVIVYEIIGTGIPTISGIEYRRFPCFTTTCVLNGNEYMKPYPLLTTAGDETVVALSAGAYDGEKTSVVVDLMEEGKGILSVRHKHPDLTESPTVQSLVTEMIMFPNISANLDLVHEYTQVASAYTVIGVHSPVEILVETTSGQRVGYQSGEYRNEVIGADYFELGGSRYVIMPQEIDYKVILEGTDAGVYSLTIDEIRTDGEQVNLFTNIGASSTPELRAVFSVTDEEYSLLETDSNGDGVIDLVLTLSGEVIENEVTYTDLFTILESLPLKKSYKKLLLAQAKLAYRFSLHKRNHSRIESIILENIARRILQYEGKQVIDSSVTAQIIKIINKLK